MFKMVSLTLERKLASPLPIGHTAPGTLLTVAAEYYYGVIKSSCFGADSDLELDQATAQSRRVRNADRLGKLRREEECRQRSPAAAAKRLTPEKLCKAPGGLL